MAYALQFDGLNDYAALDSQVNFPTTGAYEVEIVFTLEDKLVNDSHYILYISGNSFYYNSSTQQFGWQFSSSDRKLDAPSVDVFGKRLVIKLIQNASGHKHISSVEFGDSTTYTAGRVFSILNVCASNGLRFEGQIEYIKVSGALSHDWDAAASSHAAGTPVLTDTISGNNATGVNMPTDGSAWVDLGGGNSVTSVITEALNPFSDSSIVNIVNNVSIEVTEVLSVFSDLSTINISPSVSVAATVTEVLNSFSDSSVITIVEAEDVALNVTESLSAFSDSSTLDVSANVNVNITEVLNSFLDGSNVTIRKDVLTQATEIFASFDDNSFVRMPTSWVDKAPVNKTYTTYTIKPPVTTNWTDKG